MSKKWKLHSGPTPWTEIMNQDEVAKLAKELHEMSDYCPACHAPLKCASGGGVVCTAKCGWWFCY